MTRHDDQITAKAANMRKTRKAVQTNQQVLLNLQTAVAEQEAELETVTMATLLHIYDALGYARDLPEERQADIIMAISAVHYAAIGNGYTWNGDGYEGDKAVGLEYVRGRVIEQMGMEVVV